MKCHLKQSGGFSFFSREGEMDLNELEPSLKNRAEAFLDPQKLQALNDTDSCTVADGMDYQISFTKDGQDYYFSFSDADLSPEMMNVMDELLQVISKK